MHIVHVCANIHCINSCIHDHFSSPNWKYTEFINSQHTFTHTNILICGYTDRARSLCASVWAAVLNVWTGNCTCCHFKQRIKPNNCHLYLVGLYFYSLSHLLSEELLLLAEDKLEQWPTKLSLFLFTKKKLMSKSHREERHNKKAGEGRMSLLVKTQNADRTSRAQENSIKSLVSKIYLESLSIKQTNVLIMYFHYAASSTWYKILFSHRVQPHWVYQWKTHWAMHGDCD